MNNFNYEKNANNAVFITFDNFNKAGLKHGFSTRLGGVSREPFNELNLGIKSGDSIDNVILNRKIFCEAAGIDFNSLVCAQQTHSANVYLAEEKDAGRGGSDYDAAIKDTDALITNRPNVALMLFFADCVPVMIYDPVQKAIGLSHAGWKGTLAKISQKTVLQMNKYFRTKPSDCLIAIGPSISGFNYEVDETVAAAFKEAFSYWQEFIVPSGGRYLLDLWQANAIQLEKIGVLNQNIQISGICTYGNIDLYYSHRGENGVTGRMGAVITL